MWRDIFVVDAEQPVVARRRAARQRHEGDEVAIVAEALLLAGGVELGGLEGRRAGLERIAPGNHHIGAVSRRHMGALVIDALEFVEAEARCRCLGYCLAGEQRADKARCTGGAQSGRGACQERPTRIALGNDVAEAWSILFNPVAHRARPWVRKGAEKSARR